jgi:hypothetical protein
MKLDLTFATENLLPGINADIFFLFTKLCSSTRVYSKLTMRQDN